MNTSFIFFGTPALACTVLNELEKAGYIPSLVVTQPDKRAGRGNTLVSPPVKEWAQARSIPVLQPAKITEEVLLTIRTHAQEHASQFFVVAAYGKILPQTLLDIPPRGTLNVHPSLLPRLRGPSPIQSAILHGEQKTGVSIMLLDALMDHGPILAQEESSLPVLTPARELEAALAEHGGALLARTIPAWLNGEIAPREQDHTQATFCRLLKKEDGYVDLTTATAEEALRIIRGCDGWPTAYTFFERRGERVRVQLLSAHCDGDTLCIDTVKPEGKGDMKYADFLRSGAMPLPR
jgi:methionyl-tRNA formyltransferase